MFDGPGPAIVACGALASDLKAVLSAQGLGDVVEIRYLPANLHNRPERIVPSLEPMLDGFGDRRVLIAYADCGTGGELDRLLERYPNASRIPGAHCYEFFAGSQLFNELHEAELGTFYLTDFLAKHFDALIWQGLGMDRHPQLRDMYFGHYRRVVLLSQLDTPGVVEAGRWAAERLGLQFEHRHVGRTGLASAVEVVISRRSS